MRHAAASVALGHHNLNLKFEQLPRPLRRGTGGSRLGVSAASPVHESRNRPAVIDASIRGVLVSQIAFSVGHASIGQVERASPDLPRRSQLVSKTNWACWDRGTQCRHHRALRIILASVRLRDHAADDR
jgi:hypothetical protein